MFFRKRNRIRDLEAALRPFAEYADAFKEWRVDGGSRRFGQGFVVLQEPTLPHELVLRWMQPTSAEFSFIDRPPETLEFRAS